MPRLIWVFAGRTCHFVGFVMRWLICFVFLTALSRPTLSSSKPCPRDQVIYSTERLTPVTWEEPAFEGAVNLIRPEYRSGKIKLYLFKHTSHISHCEIKSHRIWPLWKPSPIRFFKTHRIFRPSYKIFYEEININHPLLCLSQASYV